MFFVFTPDNKAKAERRLFTSGIDLIDADPATWEVGAEGLELTAFDVDDGIATTKLQVAVRKNCLAVSVNPKLSARLGYQPAAPQYLYPGHFGPVAVVWRQGEQPVTSDLKWLVRLHVVPVTVL